MSTPSVEPGGRLGHRRLIPFPFAFSSKFFWGILGELCTISSSDDYEDSRHFRGIPSNHYPTQP